MGEGSVKSLGNLLVITKNATLREEYGRKIAPCPKKNDERPETDDDEGVIFYSSSLRRVKLNNATL